MFVVRPYEDRDASACGECLYEGFFTCPVTDNDMDLLRDYVKALVAMSNFTYVAEAEDGKVVGFISGKYEKGFARSLKPRQGEGRARGILVTGALKFLLGGFGLSGPFRQQFNGFLRQVQEADPKMMGRYDLELLALASRRDYRRGLGTALLARFLERAREDGAVTVKVFTNTLAYWEFYERRGFSRVAEKPFPDGGGNLSLVYEYRLDGDRGDVAGAATGRFL